LEEQVRDLGNKVRDRDEIIERLRSEVDSLKHSLAGVKKQLDEETQRFLRERTDLERAKE
jgi:peptidoglycan hydrolase CwlO-like protein